MAFLKAPIIMKKAGLESGDFLTSGVFAAHYVNTVSPTFLSEIVENRHPFIETCLRNELSSKYYAGCATGILNAPEPEFNPSVDELIRYNYGPKNHRLQKAKNNGTPENSDLEVDENAVMFSGLPVLIRFKKDAVFWQKLCTKSYPNTGM
jgi:glycogen synthase